MIGNTCAVYVAFYKISASVIAVSLK